MADETSLRVKRKMIAVYLTDKDQYRMRELAWRHRTTSTEISTKAIKNALENEDFVKEAIAQSPVEGFAMWMPVSAEVREALRELGVNTSDQPSISEVVARITRLYLSEKGWIGRSQDNKNAHSA
jgi:hypothetical protein